MGAASVMEALYAYVEDGIYDKESFDEDEGPGAFSVEQRSKYAASRRRRQRAKIDSSGGGSGAGDGGGGDGNSNSSSDPPPSDDEDQGVLLTRRSSGERASTSTSSSSSSSSYVAKTTTLPVLYRPKPRPNSLRDLVRREARRRKLWAAESQPLCDDDVRRALAALEAAAVEGGSGTGEPRVDYDGFAQAAAACAAALGPRAAPLFRAGAFLRFERDAAGAVGLPICSAYLARHANALQLLAQLAAYDADGTGELGPAELEQYLLAVASELPPIAEAMEPWFAPHYAAIAARKLLFFHGRRRRVAGGGSSGSTGTAACEPRVRLADLMASPVMMELQDLRAHCLSDGGAAGVDLSGNWFSLESARRVHATFHAWDADASGGLSRAEFSRIGQGAMTELFIARVFEEHAAPAARPAAAAAAAVGDGGGGGGDGASPPGLRRLRTSCGDPPCSSGCGDGVSDNGAAAAQQPVKQPPPPPPRDEMGLPAFADFVLAWDHRAHPAAVPYFFAILDLGRKGYLTRNDLHAFFREVHALWLAMGECADLAPADVVDEVLDMAAPARPERVTPRDLRACGMAGTIFSILASVDQFYTYNYRENFIHANDAAAGGTGEGEGEGGAEFAVAAAAEEEDLTTYLEAAAAAE